MEFVLLGTINIRVNIRKYNKAAKSYSSLSINTILRKDMIEDHLTVLSIISSKFNEKVLEKYALKNIK